MISLKQAKSIISENIFILKDEKVNIKQSVGRILRENIVASFPSPRFDNSAMDGFAVRAGDTKNATADKPTELKIVDISSAGTPSDITIGLGECIQCMTGAEIPKGADSIVMVEDTSGFSDNSHVKVMISVPHGAHIRKKGEEINIDDLLIKKGTRITANELGTCATFGYGKLSVSKKPKISIFGTGNELVEPGEKLAKGQIYNSNLYVFKDLAEKAGSKIEMSEVIKDDKDSLKSFLSEALEVSDVIISSGGVSMGRYDYVRDVFIDLGVKEHFWKVAQKPGKPLFFGTKENKLIFGLPGNPVSSFIGFMEWVWPVLITMMGEKSEKSIYGILDEPFPRERTKHRFLFGRAKYKNGKLVCRPTNRIGSHMLTSALGANCILGSDPGEGSLNPGDLIKVNLLPWKNIQ
jgi:molybdopterin molybdotransferase|tara:strand:- start:34 stop:1257 length:1224 start_codon:yes stop_codon:yes gene_type:complete